MLLIKILIFFNKIREKANMLPETHKDKIVSFHSSYKFYLLNAGSLYSVLALIVLNNYETHKIRYYIYGVINEQLSHVLLDNDIICKIHGNL